MERLDKIISKNLNITRSEAKSLIKSGAVSVDGKIVKSPEFKCDSADIKANGKRLNNSEFVYIMMNKPKGVVCASEDKKDKTVIDLLPDEMKRKDLFPAGRLDKDTEGFVLITDDGAFAHDILSPKKHVEKTYIARLDRAFDEETVLDFESGMTLGDEKLLPAKIEAINGDFTLARVVIKQGIYHQIKRMFKKHGITVLDLKRIKIGSLSLDESLESGKSRYIGDEELLLIRQ